MLSAPAIRSAQEGTRTPTPFREADFKSAASAIPPPGHNSPGSAKTGYSKVAGLNIV